MKAYSIQIRRFCSILNTSNDLRALAAVAVQDPYLKYEGCDFNLSNKVLICYCVNLRSLEYPVVKPAL